MLSIIVKRNKYRLSKDENKIPSQAIWSTNFNIYYIWYSFLFYILKWIDNQKNILFGNLYAKIYFIIIYLVSKYLYNI